MYTSVLIKKDQHVFQGHIIRKGSLFFVFASRTQLVLIVASGHFPGGLDVDPSVDSVEFFFLHTSMTLCIPLNGGAPSFSTHNSAI